MRNWVVQRRYQRDLVAWQRAGKPVPPPHLAKQQVLRHYARTYGLRILVETGTFYGDMVEAMRADFDRVYSIELSKELHQRATQRFSGVENVELIQGDSGTELGNVLKRIEQPALFWLDGHYSAGPTAKGHKDTPIFEELEHILSAQALPHVIIIDDARCFGADADYPSLDELGEFVRQKRPAADILVQDDSIRITPPRGASGRTA